MVEQWSMKGSIFAGCSCDWGCPCNFDVPPTNGRCNGGYVWHVDEGRYGDVPLADVKFTWLCMAPGPLHEGNVTTTIIIDEGASEPQREAIRTLFEGNGAGLPFDILAAVTGSTETVVAPIETKIDGINTEARIGGGELYELALARIKNPVTGDDEELYLDKPTGFTSRRAELGMTTRLKAKVGLIDYEHSGMYGEYSRFEYAGPA